VWRERYTFGALSSLDSDIFLAAGAGIPTAAGLVCPAVDNRARFRP